MKSLTRVFMLVLTMGLFFSWIGHSAASEARGQKLRKLASNRSQALRFLKKMNLTDSQRVQIRQLRAAYRKKMAEIAGQIKVKKVELESEMEKSKPEQKKLDQINQEIGELKKQRMSETVKANLELEKNILTPEQVDQLKANQKEANYGSGEELDDQE
jgi:Spy/CpxP family protein refolding chaperone